MKKLSVFGLFCGVCALVFWPVWPQFTTHPIADNLDWVHNFWTFNWSLKSILSGFSGYWHPPFYSPLSYSLGYNDHNLGVGLLALPFYLLTKNPLLSFNLMVVGSFLLTGFFTYLLCFELTKNHWASFVAGCLYAFGAPRFEHLGHLHMLVIQGIPLFFYFGIRFLNSKKWVYFYAGALCVVWQLFASLGLGLFAFYCSALFYLYAILTNRNLQSKQTLVRLIGFHFIFGLVMIVAAWPNLQIRWFEGVEAWKWSDVVLGASSIGNYFVVGFHHRLYMDWMDPFTRGVGGHTYFLGFTTLTFLIYAIFSWLPKSRKSRKKTPIFLRIVDIVLVIGIISAITIFFEGLWDEKFYASVSIKDKIEFSSWVLLALFLRIGFSDVNRHFIGRILNSVPIQPRFFLILGILSVIFSFSFFYKPLWLLVPGFDGMRVPGRLNLIAHLCFVVVASFGLKVFLEASLRNMKWKILGVVLIFGFIFDCFLWKPKQQKVPTFSEKYHELISAPETNCVLNIPLPATTSQWQHQAPFVYANTMHWKPFVAGYSAIFPVYYKWLIPIYRAHGFIPVSYLEILGVNTVVFNWERVGWGEKGKVRAATQEIGNQYNLIHESPELSAYRVKESNQKPIQPVNARSLPDGTTFKASRNQKKLKRLVDHKSNKKWSTKRAQKTGDWIEINLNSPQDMKGITMNFGLWALDYPRGLKIEIHDESGWTTVYEEAREVPHPHEFRTIIANPQNPTFYFEWPMVKASGIRLTLTEDHPSNHWSIAELKML